MKSAIIVMTLMLFAVPALAETYQWIDNQGTVNFTEDPGSIPKQYRKKAKVLGGEEAAPAVSGEGTEGAQTGSDDKGKGKVAEPPAGAKKGEKKAYGGRSSDAWKTEFDDLNGRIKDEEEQLSGLKERMNDTSKMSRGEYLSVQMGIKSSESRLNRLKQRRDELTTEANRAGVPTDQR